MTEHNTDYRQIVENFYVSNIRNRLRELETADDDELTRWIWELIQNAKDCSKELVNIPKFITKFKAVDINIEYKENDKILIFQHNGIPFTNETLYSLMYKYSSKNDKEESTGRFGTGFMTSHTLSRIVDIKAPFLYKNEDSYELQYVEATIFREGSNEKQYREEFRKMEKSKKFYPYNVKKQNCKWTTFTYKLDEKGIHSANLGIQSLYNNIKKVFLLCDKINSIRINNEEIINLSMISTKQLKIEGDPKYSIFKKKIKDEKFIVASFEELNEQYSKKYSKDVGEELKMKKLNFDIVIQIDSKSQIVNRKSREICVLCTFPLIGSEDFQLPYVINCPVFETSTERKGLILDGDENDLLGILTNSGLNRLILNKSIDLFANVLDYFIQNNYSNYASFSDGVQLWNPFTQKIKSVLENKPIVHDSSNQPQLLKKIIFIDFNNINDKKLLYDLSSSFYENIASYDDCIKWNNKTWNELSVLNIETFVKNIICIGKQIDLNSTTFYQRNNEFFKNGLNSLTENDLSLLNRFYTFLLREETKSKSFDEIARNSQFLKEKIILNSNCQFAYLIDLKSNSKFSDDMNKIMNECKSWNSSIIHPKIKSFDSIIPEKTIDEAIQEVNLYIMNNKNNIDVLRKFAKFVIKDDKHRKKMYKIADYFLDIPKKISVTKIDPILWEKVDYFLLIQINEKISNKSTIDLSSIKHYNNFYKLYQRIVGKIDFMVPNYNLVLKEPNQLRILSKNIPQVLLDTIKSFYSFDNYIHPLIKSVTLKKNVDDLDYFINLFKSKDFFYSYNKLIENRLFAILGILPPESIKRLYNFQMKIREIAQFFFNTTINESKTNIKDETFWETADEIVITYVTDKLNQFKTIKKLKSNLKDNEINIFKYLNTYYSIISSNYQDKKDTVLIPNYYGTFILGKNLFIGKGLKEKLFDLINRASKESDIKEKIAHPQIQCDFIKIMDFEYFIKLLNEKLSEEQLVNDKIIVDSIINDLGKFNEQSTNIFEKLYIANMKNRLNEIQNPTDSDKIRWPMELMQNAKDSLFSPSNLNQQKKVEINIEVTYKKDNPIKVVFSHNGPAFTENSFYGLLFKICEDKNHSKSTGKFGTGFISTHVLSKIVNVSGNKIDNNNKISGFSVTLHREGTNDKDIIKDYKTMTESFRLYNKTMDLTKFEYQIDSNESRECVKLGLIHFKKHISNVLINCKEIKCVNLFENKKKTSYSASKIIKNQINKFFIYKYQTHQNTKLLQQFILLKNDEKISISIEIDCNNKIIPRDKETESIFSVFPLVGSKSHILPFFLSSSHLEPVTERNALILHGKEIINGKTTNAGMNRSIMMKSIDLFESLIQYLNGINCSNMYELSYGLLLSRNPYESFNLNWYQTTFLTKIRNVILNGVKAKTYFGESLLLREIIFTSNRIRKEHLQTFIELASRFFKNIICLEDELLWKNRIWNTVHMISIEDLIDHVENDESILKEKDLVYLNKFLLFIWNANKDLLYEHSIIPDMNGDFHCLSNGSDNLKECKTVTNQIIEMMQSINIPWKSTHMSNYIHTIKLAEDKMIDAESRIIEKIKQENELSYNLMKFVLKGNELRKNMFDFVNLLQMKHFIKPIIVTDINIKIWEIADEYVLKQMVLKISSLDSEYVKNHIDFFKKFLTIFFKYFNKDKNYIKSCKIIPNANYNLCKFDELYKKVNNIHDFLNPILTFYFGIDFNEKIFNPQITEFIESNKEESITDFLDIINEKIDNMDNYYKIIIAESVISIVPTNTNNNNSLQEPKEIFSLCHDLLNSDIIEHTIDDKHYLPHYWEKCKAIIISEISKKVEDCKTLKNFQNYYNLEDEDEAFTKLNLLYKYCDDKYEIIPNRKGVFMSKNHLKADPGIKNDILDCFSLMDPDNDFMKKIVHSKVKIDGLSNFNIFQIIRQFNELYISTKDREDVSQKIKDILSNIFNENPFLRSSNKMTNDDRFRMEILINGHVNYVKNRMRDLDNATNDDFNRWPFELIQNAGDCVRDSKQKVSMTFEFEDNCVNFIHNGIPFTYKTLNALLYQTSEGKEENKLSVGRFGTGFMATHILSRIIHISGDIESNESNNKKVVGFDVTINREGNKRKELIKGIETMEKNMETNKTTKGFTKFQYDLSNVDVKGENSNAKAYKQGLSSLISNIPQILIFNHSIESIVLKTNNNTTKYIAKHEKGPIQTVTAIYGPFKKEIHKFVLFDNKCNNDDIKVQCLLQIDNNNNIIKNFTNFLFLSYPMFGENHFRSPVMINSPNFEPDKERNKLVIQENMKEDDEGNESLKNKSIISESVDIFKQIIQYAINNKFNNLFNLCYGLKYNSMIEFIQKNYVLKMREVILEFSVFQTQNGLKKYDEILIPCIDKFCVFNLPNNSKDSKYILYKEFYQLVSKLSIDSKHLVDFNDCLKWNQLIWNDFSSKFNFKQLFTFISSYKNISDLPFLIECSREEYINDIILFVEKMNKCNTIFSEYKILINMNGDLTTKDDVFYFNVPQEFIEMLDIVKYNYHEIMLHEKISHIYSNANVKFNQFDISRAIHEINDKINNDNAIEFIKFVIENDRTREKMFYYTQLILQKKFNKIILASEYSYDTKIKEMFRKVDTFVSHRLIKHIQNNFDIQENINIIKGFVEMIKYILPSNVFDEEKIIPNQNYQLCFICDLYVDQIKNENLINSLKTLFDYDLKNILVHESFKSMKNFKKMDFNTLSSIIIDLLNRKNISDKSISDRVNFYSIFLQNPAYIDESIRVIIDLFKIFFKINVEKNYKLDVWSNELTKIVAGEIIEDITLKISSFSNIDDSVNSDGELKTLYKVLSCLYLFTTNNKIFPNMYNDLKCLKDIKLYYDPRFDIRTLLELFKFFVRYDQSFEIEESILNISIVIHEQIRNRFSIFDINYVHDKIKAFIEKNPDNNYGDFFEYINKSHQLKIVFSDIIDAKKEEIPLKFLGNTKFMHFMNHIYKVYESENKVYESENEQIPTNNYLGEAFVYEEMKKSEKYKLVNWLALSKYKTDISIEMNGKIYYIDDKGKQFDIYAEDWENNKYYVEVKSNDFDEKLFFCFNEYHFDFETDSNCYFYFAFVKNARSNPQILWLKKDNPLEKKIFEIYNEE